MFNCSSCGGRHGSNPTMVAGPPGLALDWAGFLQHGQEAWRLEGTEKLLAAAAALQGGPACHSVAALCGQALNLPVGWLAHVDASGGAHSMPAQLKLRALQPPPGPSPSGRPGTCPYPAAGQSYCPALEPAGNWAGSCEGGSCSRSRSAPLPGTTPRTQGTAVACTPTFASPSEQSYPSAPSSGPGPALLALSLPHELASTVEWVVQRSPGLQEQEVLMVAALVESQKHYTRMKQLKAAMVYMASLGGC